MYCEMKNVHILIELLKQYGLNQIVMAHDGSDILIMEKLTQQITICKNQKCTGCETCLQVCPTKSIRMEESTEGFKYPKIDTDSCVFCKKCIRVCPNNKDTKTFRSKFFMGWHKDRQILKKSSSGGAFTAIADMILEQDGIIFGVYFEKNDFSVRHISVEKSADLDKLRLSKYFQGSINDSYKHVETKLKNDRQVLFTGTACQIAGLYSYLSKEYNNLITVDVLCHGVTSKKVINAYIKSKEKQYKKRVNSFRFRIKPDDGDWLRGGGTRMRIDFMDGNHVVENKEKDTFFVGFNQYLFLRKSCYQCKYVGIERIADITLADFWGVDLSKIPDEQRRYGVSLILANSPKGKGIICKLQKDMYISEIEEQEAIPHNQALKKPSSFNINRTSFFNRIDDVDFDKLVKKYNRMIYIKIKMRYIFGDKIYDCIKKIFGRTVNS